MSIKGEIKRFVQDYKDDDENILDSPYITNKILTHLKAEIEKCRKPRFLTKYDAYIGAYNQAINDAIKLLEEE